MARMRLLIEVSEEVADFLERAYLQSLNAAERAADKTSRKERVRVMVEGAAILEWRDAERKRLANLDKGES